MALTRSTVAQKFAKTMNRPDKILAVFAEVAAAGEDAAIAGGYADIVTKGLGHIETDVVIAALKTLASLGQAGSDYLGEIGACLTMPDSSIQIAALDALGKFGYEAKDFSHKASSMIDNEDIDVKVAAMLMLGSVRADEEAAKIMPFLFNDNTVLVCAACDALSNLGLVKDHTDVLSGMLKKDSTRYSAVAAVAAMGALAPLGLLDTVITEGLGSADGSVRELAVQVVGNLAEAALSDPYLKSLKSLLGSSSAGARAAAATALGAMGPTAVKEADALVPLLMDDAEESSGPKRAQVLGTVTRRSSANYRLPKAAAVYALGNIKAMTFLDKVVECLNDKNWEVRVVALESLAAFGASAKGMAAPVAASLSDAAFPVRAAAAVTLGVMGAEDEISAIVNALGDKSHTVRLSAVLALADIGEPAWSCSHDVFKLLQDPVVQVQSAAARCLSLMGDVGGNYAAVLATLLNQSGDPELRTELITGLGRMGKCGAAFAEDVADGLTDRNWMVRDAAMKSLMQMGQAGKPFLRAAGWLDASEEPASLMFDIDSNEGERSLPAPSRNTKSYMSALAQERAKLGI